jgi:hypothetical protein
MCDYFSWIEKGKKLYFLDDATIEARWPNDDIRDHIGHAAIEEVFPESRGGKHVENAINIPSRIAAEINQGHMDKMAKAGQWTGARYTACGHLCSNWWENTEEFIKAVKKIKWLNNHGNIKSEWLIFDTRAAAEDAARACDSARDAAWAAARDVALYARCLMADPGLPHSKHVTDRLDVWLQGYGLLCDINGILYVYKKVI